MDALRSAWEEFIDGSDPEPAGVPPAILASWRRSRELAVSPELRIGPWSSQPSDDGPTARLIKSAGTRAVQELAADLRGAGCVVVLADAAGVVLARAGDPDITRRTDAAQMAPGAAWSESSAGTNGIGLALALGRPVQVVAAEHFCAGWHAYGCTTAPVHHPLTGELLATLTLTTRARLHDRPFVAALVGRTARAVEYAIDEQLSSPVRALLSRHLAGPPDSPRLTVGRGGEVVLENEAAAQRVVGPIRDAVLGAVRAALDGPFDAAEAVAVPGGRAQVRVTIVRWRDEVAGAVACVEGALPVTDATLRDLEREAILSALARSSGNVTEAAAELGISRATVYRRLRTYRVYDSRL